VRFTFNERHYDNVARAAGLGVVPEHLYDGLTDRQIRQSTALLMGTGPYRLQDPHEYTPGSQIEGVRNNRYWGEQPTFDRLVWRIIEQDSTELVEFQNGTVDIIAPQPRDHIQMIEDEQLLKEKNYKVYDTMRTLYQYVAWNQQRGGEPTIFADKRVRRAMTLLIDRERLLNEVFLGFGSIASGPFHEISPQANPNIQPWPHDPDQAMEVLREVGFTRAGEDTPLLDPDGNPFEITLVYPSGSELYDRVALSLRDNLARAGINLKLDPQRWSLLLATLDSRDFDAITLGWGAGGVESDIEQMFHSRTIDGGDNRNAYSSPELDEIIDTAHVTLDDDERMKLWQQAHRILHEDQPYTFLLFGKPRLWYDNRIEGIVEMPKLGINAATTWPVPIEWYVPEGQQKR
ncbi:MAG: ABC transporter substrate-binding protein, partial [Phycisphaeraceae bacterium]